MLLSPSFPSFWVILFCSFPIFKTHPRATTPRRHGGLNASCHLGTAVEAPGGPNPRFGFLVGNPKAGHV
jgi:hypothetical protein